MKRNKILGAAAVCLLILAGIWAAFSGTDHAGQSTDSGSGTAAVSQPKTSATQEDSKPDDQPDSETINSTQVPSNSSTVKKDPHEWEDPERPIHPNSSAENSDANAPDSGADTSDTPNDSGSDQEEHPSENAPATPPKDQNDLSVTEDNQGGFGKLQ